MFSPLWKLSRNMSIMVFFAAHAWFNVVIMTVLSGVEAVANIVLKAASSLSSLKPELASKTSVPVSEALEPASSSTVDCDASLYKVQTIKIRNPFGQGRGRK